MLRPSMAANINTMNPLYACSYKHTGWWSNAKSETWAGSAVSWLSSAVSESWTDALSLFRIQDLLPDLSLCRSVWADFFARFPTAVSCVNPYRQMLDFQLWWITLTIPQWCYFLQVISMLRGSRSPGAAFEWDLNSRSFSVPNSLFLPDLSPGLLRDLLQHFAQLGTIACRSASTYSGHRPVYRPSHNFAIGLAAVHHLLAVTSFRSELPVGLQLYYPYCNRCAWAQSHTSDYESIDALQLQQF